MPANFPEALTYCPLVSIVIPTIGRDQELANTIRDLDCQDYPRMEIVVVDQSSEELSKTKEYLSQRGTSAAEVQYLRQSRPSASAARNLGLIASRGEIVIFLDDDVRIASVEFVSHHVRNFRQHVVTGVAGQILTPSQGPRNKRHPWSHALRFGWLYFPVNYSARCIQSGVGGAGNLSVRRSAALKIGGMDERYVKGAFREESDFIVRLEKAGGVIIFDPMPSLVHLACPRGGIRSWRDVTGSSRAFHHLVGEWYFILAHVRGIALVHNAVGLLRNQKLVPRSIGDFIELPKRCIQSIRALLVARRQVKDGPLTLHRADVLKCHEAIVSGERASGRAGDVH